MTTNLTFTYPLVTLYLTFSYPFIYPLVTPDLKPTGGIVGDENKKQEVRLCDDQRYR